MKLGDSPITSAVAGGSRGFLQALDGAGGVNAGVLALAQADGTLQYLNIDDDDKVRFGSADPSGDPETNSLLAASTGALLTDGTNWLSNCLQAAAAMDLKSRRNVTTDVDDDFSDGDLNTGLWRTYDVDAQYEIDEVTSPGRYLEHMIVAGGTASGAFIRSRYQLTGDFDFQIAVAALLLTGSSTSDPGFVWILGAVLASEADVDVATWIASPTAAIAADGCFIRNEARGGGANNRARAFVTNAGVETADADVVDVLLPVGGQFRITRSGTTFTAFYRLDPGDGWTQVAQGTGPAGTVEVIIGIRNDDGGGAGLNVGDFTGTTDFQLTSGSASKAVEDGPYSIVEGFGSGLPAGESFWEVYDGPQDTLLAKVAYDAASEPEIVSGESDVTRGVVRIAGESVGNDPGLLVLENDTPAALFLWAAADGIWYGTAKPTTPATDGIFMGPIEQAGIAVSAGGGTQNTSGTPDAFEVITQWTSNMAGAKGAAANSGGFVVTIGSAGTYRVDWTISFGGATTTEYTVRPFVEGVALADGEGQRQIGSTNEIGSFSGRAYFIAAAGDDIDLRVAADVATKAFAVMSGSMMVQRVG